MMVSDVQHVRPVTGGWAVQDDADPELQKVFDDEADAVHYAWHAVGVGGQIIVHEEDGTTDVFFRTGDNPERELPF
jgi:hypothetical protein